MPNDSIPPFTLDDSPNPQSSNGDNPVAAAAAAAMASAATSKRGRGRPRKDGSAASGTGAPSATSPTPSATMRAEIARQMEALYNPKAWESLLCMPADSMLAITGKDRWRTEAMERKTVGECGGVAARFLAFENPKTLALLMLSSALFTMYVPRATAELKEYMADKKKSPEKKDETAK